MLRRAQGEKTQRLYPIHLRGRSESRCDCRSCARPRKAGADIIELGLPFSDPLADGIVNQLAAQRALEGGATTRGVLDCVRQIRQRSEIPIALYTYLNPIFQFGFDKFHREAEAAGVDGLLILDLPPDEDLISQNLTA